MSGDTGDKCYVGMMMNCVLRSHFQHCHCLVQMNIDGHILYSRFAVMTTVLPVTVFVKCIFFCTFLYSLALTDIYDFSEMCEGVRCELLN